MSPEYSRGFKKHIRQEKAKARIAGTDFVQPPEPLTRTIPVDLTKKEDMLSSLEASPNYKSELKPHLEAIAEFWESRNRIFNGESTTEAVRAEIASWTSKYESNGNLPDQVYSFLTSITKAFDEKRNRLQKK